MPTETKGSTVGLTLLYIEISSLGSRLLPLACTIAQVRGPLISQNHNNAVGEPREHIIYKSTSSVQHQLAYYHALMVGMLLHRKLRCIIYM